MEWREYPPFQQPFVEAETTYGVSQAVALAWAGDLLKVRFPAVIWPNGGTQFMHAEVIPVAWCRPIRERDARWREHFLDRAWHAERDAGITYRPDPERSYPQSDGTIYRRRLALVHKARRGGLDETKIRILPEI